MPLDIGLGILWTLFVAHIFNVEPSWWLFVFGIGSALLPDIDMILRPLQRHVFKSWPQWLEYNHRVLPHYPAIYVPLTLFVYICAGPMLTVLFALCVYSHLIHDTFGLGWGIKWLWPFSHTKFLFPEKGRRDTEGFVMVWTPEEEPALAIKYHNPNWVRDYYFRANAIAFVEYGFFAISLLVLFLS